jgi:hypothetical protein
MGPEGAPAFREGCVGASSESSFRGSPASGDRSDRPCLRNVCHVSRRDNPDRSLARSAWESVPSKEPSRKNRSVGYGVSGRSYPRGLSRRNVHRAHTCTKSDRTLRDGSFGVALFQALRARLHSHRPSGAFRTAFSMRLQNVCQRVPEVQLSGDR